MSSAIKNLTAPWAESKQSTDEFALHLQKTGSKTRQNENVEEYGPEA